MRSLAVALTLAILAAACSTSFPALGTGDASAGADVTMWVVATGPSEATDGDAAPRGDEAGDAEETAQDDSDGDDGEMIAMLRSGPSLAPLEARDIRWSLRLSAARFDHAPSDLIRPPIPA